VELLSGDLCVVGSEQSLRVHHNLAEHLALLPFQLSTPYQRNL
jgi:hypothetical protein